MAENEQKLDFSNLADKNLASLIDELYKAGAHFGYSKGKRSPSVREFIFGSKNKTDIVDLEKMAKSFKGVLEYVAKLGSEGKQILFVGDKKEAQKIVTEGAKSIGMPFVALRWIGGTITNASEIRKRVARMEDLMTRKAAGALDVYTKKERLLLDREVAKLEKHFGGVVSMKRAPAALVVIDPKQEVTAVAEANQAGIPVIALAGTDCDITNITYPIVANDASVSSITLFINKIVEAYKTAPKIVVPASPVTVVAK